MAALRLTLGAKDSIDDLISLLETHHVFDSDIPDVERRRIVNEAVREAARSGEITEKTLKGNILKNVNLFKNKPVTDYVMATSLSIKQPKDLRKLTFDQAGFIFSASLPPAFSRANIEGFQHQKPANDLPPGFTTVRVKVQARSDFDAFHKAIDSLDFLRGIWNFRVNRGTIFRWHSGMVKPVNTIRLGSGPHASPANRSASHDAVLVRAALSFRDEG